MRHAPLVLLFVLVLFGCAKHDGTCDAACKSTEAKYGLTDRTIHAADQATFADADGLAYTLVRFEYGDTAACDDDDCSYSTYCAFVVDGVDYPVQAYFVSEADALFDLDDYCDDLGCDLPGYDLAIFDDDDFDDWLFETAVEDDILVSCFDDY